MGTDESWGGVRINIDRNYLNLRTPKLPGHDHARRPRRARATPARRLSDPLCTPQSINRSSYRRSDAKSWRATIITAQCLLKQQHEYPYAVTGKWNPQTLKALNDFQKRVGHPVRAYVSQADWMSLLTAGASGAPCTRARAVPTSRGCSGP